MEKQPESVIEAVELRLIASDTSMQCRVRTDEKTVEDYVAAMTDGDIFPPIQVLFDGTQYWVVDGFHRLAAARAAKLTRIRAEIRHGDRRAALLASAGANATHGLRRTNADKNKAVRVLLDDPEWSTWSTNEIAQRCGVSDYLVAKIRRAHLPEQEDSHTENEVNHLASPTKRKALRGGVEYEVETGAIGRTKPTTSQRRVDESYADPVYQDDAEYVPPERQTAATPAPATPPAPPAPAPPPPPPPPPAATAGLDPRDARIAQLEAEVAALKAEVVGLRAEAEELDTKARKMTPPKIDAVGQEIPEDLRPIFGRYEEYRRQAHAHLQSLLKVGKKWLVVIREEAERVGIDRAVLLREYNGLASAFESNPDSWASTPRGAISMVAPSAVCIDCVGKGCDQCTGRGWFGGANYVAFADRELVRLNRKPKLNTESAA